MTCKVEQRGSTRITYYCQDGYICDFPVRKCLPGPELKRKAEKALEEARRMALENNRRWTAEQEKANAKVAPYTKGSTYYRWNGDPRIMPTPRRAPGSGLRPTPAPNRSATLTRRLQQANVRRETRTQVVTLVLAALQFPPGDANRASLVKAARKLVREKKIPIDLDEYIDCGPGRVQKVENHKVYELRWRVPDIPFEIAKRGLCPQEKGSAEYDACVAYQFGQVVMDVEPDIKAICKLQENDFQEKDLAALGECAERKFHHAWSQRQGRFYRLDSGIVVEPGKRCTPPGKEAQDSIRDELIKIIDAMPDTLDAPPQPAPKTDPQHSPDSPAPQVKLATSAATSDEDEAFCAFIARRVVRGELTPGGGTPIPAQCRTAVDAAKTCVEQKCSMADIIDEQEKAKSLPWGLADYQAVDQLVLTAPR
ncbi:MAG: hypothetical protein F9K29_25065 [Hyphomicrobiaceae bacterium]|nr:MAG: hypothetical protein F9K29_25065 [Hyphomicrobiaceae bacterium]